MPEQERPLTAGDIGPGYARDPDSVRVLSEVWASAEGELRAAMVGALMINGYEVYDLKTGGLNGILRDTLTTDKER